MIKGYFLFERTILQRIKKFKKIRYNFSNKIDEKEILINNQEKKYKYIFEEICKGKIVQNPIFPHSHFIITAHDSHYLVFSILL